MPAVAAAAPTAVVDALAELPAALGRAAAAAALPEGEGVRSRLCLASAAFSLSPCSMLRFWAASADRGAAALGTGGLVAEAGVLPEGVVPFAVAVAAALERRSLMPDDAGVEPLGAALLPAAAAAGEGPCEYMHHAGR